MFPRLLSALFLCALAREAAAEIFDPFAVPFKQTDLQFPNAAQPYGKEHEDMLFKPDSVGPFPGLILVPVCGGETFLTLFMTGRNEPLTMAMPSWSQTLCGSGKSRPIATTRSRSR